MIYSGKTMTRQTSEYAPAVFQATADGVGTARAAPAATPSPPKVSRSTFLKRIQLLGHAPDANRSPGGLFKSPPARPQIHQRAFVSCSREAWVEMFGEPERVEVYQADSPAHVSWNVWQHSCSDGLIMCIGHLLKNDSGVSWVVVFRISFL